MRRNVGRALGEAVALLLAGLRSMLRVLEGKAVHVDLVSHVEQMS
jgi:hypothetical protein